MTMKKRINLVVMLEYESDVFVKSFNTSWRSNGGC